MWLFKTKKDRVIKELLQTLLKAIEEDDEFYGMCSTLTRLYESNIITYDSYDLLSRYLIKHKP